MFVVGIIGGGQLAKMLALAGYPMGQKFVVLDPAADAAAGQVAQQIIGDYDDPAKLQQLADAVDVITFDFENVPANTLHALAEHKPVLPNAEALAVAQDRITEKELFRALGIPTAAFSAIDSAEDLLSAADAIGLPAVLKTRRFGYDGKGQAVIKDNAQLNNAWDTLQHSPAILEQWVPFEKEVSLISVRSKTGEIAYYPLVHNIHKQGILHLSTAPYMDSALQSQAEAYAKAVLEKLNYVGVLAIEFFVKDNVLLANEMAPRVHNTGHWTIEGAAVSQFENHLRAITGLPLGTTETHSHAAMINFISELPSAKKVLSIPGCHFHDYGKQARPGRKLGHVTLRAASEAKLQDKITRILDLIEH